MEETEDSNKVKFLVDSQGVCLFCFKDIVASNSNRRQSNPDLNYTSAQFSVLTRYLKIDLHKVLNLPDTFQIQNAVVSLKNSELAVTLCAGCTQVIDNFSKLYRELQMTQAQLTSTVEQIHNLIAGTERDTTKRNNQAKRMKTAKAPEVVQSSIVEKLRKDMVDKCSNKISKAGPLPQVIKVERMPPIEANSVILNSQPSSVLVHAPLSSSSSTTQQHVSQPQQQSKSPSKSSGSGGSISNSFNTVQKIVTPNGETRFQCTHCMELFSDRAASRLHMVRFHCEQYFLSFKPAPSQLSLQQFKDAVETLFADIATVDQGRRQKVLNRCPYCTDRTFTRKINVRAHMLDSHYEALVTKLKEILLTKKKKKGGQHLAASSEGSGDDGSQFSSPSGSPNKLMVNNKPGGSGAVVGVKHSCSRCGLTLPSKAKWLKHTRFHCKANKVAPPAVVTTVAPGGGNKPGYTFAGNPIYRTCECGANLGSPKSWQNHQKIYCKLRKSNNELDNATTTTTYYTTSNSKASTSTALIGGGGEQVILMKNDNVTYVTTDVLPVPVKCLLEEHTYASDNHQMIETEETTWIAVAEDPNQHHGATIQMTYEDGTDDGGGNVTVLATNVGHILQS